MNPSLSSQQIGESTGLSTDFFEGSAHRVRYSQRAELSESQSTRAPNIKLRAFLLLASVLGLILNIIVLQM